jgi:hypothetical protein
MANTYIDLNPSIGGGGVGDNLGDHIATKDLDMSTFAVTNVGNVDGRDVSTDGTTLDTHLNGGASKHDADEIDVEAVDGHYYSAGPLETAVDTIDQGVKDTDDQIDAHENGGANKHDADEIDVETAMPILAPSAPTDLETVLQEIEVNAQEKFRVVVKPTGTTADQTNISNALIALDAAGGGILQLVEGVYNVDTGVPQIAIENVIIQGEGDGTILQCNTDWALNLIGNVPQTAIALNNYSANATSIFTTVAANATSPAGTLLRLTGTESVLGIPELEYNEIVSSNPATGEIVLRYPTMFTMTAVNYDAYGNSRRIVLRDFRVQAALNTSYGIIASNTDYIIFDNLTIEGVDGSVSNAGALDVNHSSNIFVNNIRVHTWDGGRGFSITKTLNSRIMNCDIFDINRSAGGVGSPIYVDGGCSGVWITKNRIRNFANAQAGIYVQSPGLRVYIEDNEIIGGVNVHGIRAAATDVLITRNRIQNTGTGNGIYIESNEGRCIISYNEVINTFHAIRLDVGNEQYTVSHNIIRETLESGIFALGNSTIVTHNNLRDLGINGIAVTSVSKSEVSHNIIDNFALLAAGSGIIVQGDDVLVEGNYIDDATTAGSIGIYLFSSRCRVAKNIIRNTTSTGIFLNVNEVEVIIEQNNMDGTCPSGIVLSDGCSRCLVRENIITGTSARGLDLRGDGAIGISECQISANVVSNCSNVNIRLRGILNCTVLENISTGSTSWGMLIQDGTTVATDNFIATNNNVRSNASNFLDSSTGVNKIVTNNLIV